MKTADLVATLNEPLSEENAAEHMGAIIRNSHIPAYMIAQGLGIPERNLNRLTQRRNKPRRDTLRQLERVEKLIQDVLRTLNPKGAFEWLRTPNQYLNDVAPIQCLRSEKELEKVMGILAAIKFGFPA
jgi:uncharacterized protein (DUF2384 family)